MKTYIKILRAHHYGGMIQEVLSCETATPISNHNEFAAGFITMGGNYTVEASHPDGIVTATYNDIYPANEMFAHLINVNGVTKSVILSSEMSPSDLTPQIFEGVLARKDYENFPDCDAFRDEMWDIIRKCPQHTFQILTKRPQRITEHTPADMLQADKLTEYEKKCAAAIYGQPQSDGTEYKVKFV